MNFSRQVLQQSSHLAIADLSRSAMVTVTIPGNISIRYGQPEANLYDNRLQGSEHIIVLRNCLRHQHLLGYALTPDVLSKDEGFYWECEYRFCAIFPYIIRL